MSTTKFGDITPRQAGFAVKKLLTRAQEIVVLERFGAVDPQPKQNSLTRTYRRYNSVPPAIAPLAEGITPTGHKLTHTDVQIQLQEYGDVLRLTNRITEAHEDPILAQMSEIAGEQMGETLEVIRWESLKQAGTFVIYAGNAASRNTVARKISATELRLAARSLARSKAQKFTRIISATPGIGTTPIAASYFVLGHTDLAADFGTLPNFVPVHKYPKPSEAIPGEIGSWDCFRIVLSSNFTPFEAVGGTSTDLLSRGAEPAAAGANADIYPILVLARDAYHIVPMQGKDAVKVSAINPETITKDDPLGQRGSVGWRRYDGCGIINQQFVIRIEAGCTARPEA